MLPEWAERQANKSAFRHKKGSLLAPCNPFKRSHCVNIPFFFPLKKVSIAIILQSTKDIIVKKPQSAVDERGKEEEKTLSPCCQAAFKAGCYAWHMTKKRRGWGSPFPLPQW